MADQGLGSEREREEPSELATVKKLSVLEHLIGIILILIFILVLLQVVLRYLGNPLTWSEELSRYLQIWLAFLGGSLATRQGTHLVVGANITRNLPAGVQHGIVFIINILTIAVVIVLGIEGFKLFRNNLSHETVSMPIPMGFVWIVIPLSALIMLRYLFRDLVRSFKKAVLRGNQRC